MIEKHYNLSCYVLEHPYQVQYTAQGSEIVDLIDSNDDIYEFKLPDHENYEKIAGEWKIRQLGRHKNIWIILDQKREMVIRRVLDELYKFDNIQQFEQVQTSSDHLVLLRNNEYFPQSQLSMIIGRFSHQSGQQIQANIQFQQYMLIQQNYQQQGQYCHKFLNHNQQSQIKIQKVFGNCCIVKDKFGINYVIELMLDNFQNSLKTKCIKYRVIDIDIEPSAIVIGSLNNKMLVKNQNQIKFIDINSERNVTMPYIELNDNKLDFIVYQHFLIILDFNDLFIYETLNGSLLIKLTISNLLQNFEQGSSIVLGEAHQKQMRYCLLFDKLRSQLTHFYLMDKERTSMYYINIDTLLKNSFVNSIQNQLKELENDKEHVHQNVMKTANFRIKKLQTLQKYICEGLKIQSFGNAIRFLQNQSNIFVLNDGVNLLNNTIMNNILIYSNQKTKLIEIERDLVKLCFKLITQSKYEGHIDNGLSILIFAYSKFRSFSCAQVLTGNRQCYCKVIQSSRVVKLLKQDKKKRLFELCYELALKVKGFKYVDDIETIKKR